MRLSGINGRDCIMVARQYVRAYVRLRGRRGEVEGPVLVDTGATYTVIDRSLSEYIGVEYLGKSIELRTLCCTVSGDMAIIPFVEVEGHFVGGITVVVTNIPQDLKNMLMALDLRVDVIFSAYDARGFTIDLQEGRLRWVGLMLV